MPHSRRPATRLTISPATHTRLVALGEHHIRRLVSASTDQMGLGRFVPANTTDTGTPAPNTPWFTAHPPTHSNAELALPALQARLQWATNPAQVAAIQAIVEAIEAGEEQGAPLSDDDLRVLWADAGGDTSPIDWPDRPNQPRPPHTR